MKVGVLGLGKMGLLHLRNCRYIDGVKVIAAADKSPASQAKAKERKISMYEDYVDLINKEDVDVILVALPNYMHYSAVKLAAEAGKHIFVEKPLANSSRECEELANIARRKGIILMVGHNYRFINAVQKIKEMYDKGYIGDVEVATLELVLNGPFAPALKPTPVPEWYFDLGKIGMGSLDSGYHLIDLFLWFFGDCEVCYAELGHRYDLPYEDSAILVLKANNSSTRGIVNVGWYSKMILPQFNFRVILHGTAGYLSTDKYIPSNLYLHAAKEATKNFLRKICGLKIKPLTYTYYYESYVQELQLFFNSVKRGTQPPVTPEDSIRVMRIIEKV